MEEDSSSTGCIAPQMSQTPKRYEFLGSAAIVCSDALKRLMCLVEKIAVSNATVLITGESGSGKEVIARAIHHYSPRVSKSWVDINCAALPEHLLESELFGYEKGAFSGADSAKPGLFEIANHGTLFLDEIGDLHPKMQVKLLRVLDGSGYYRIGGVRKIAVDVRLVAATNRDLKTGVREGHFRGDLYHRLSQIQIPVPPLRERPEDIIPLASLFLSEQNPDLRLSAQAAEKMRNYSWPGNVRELRNVVIRAAVLARQAEIQVADLPEELLHDAFSNEIHGLAVLASLEKDAILKALEESRGHQESAAARLGISRRTLQRRIKSYRLAAPPPESVAI
jgi:transcriptional regulator with PAS, ATPase and Fis domain